MFYENNDTLDDNIVELLGLHNIKVDSVELSASQKMAFEYFKSGKNVLIISEAGCGKSKLAKTFLKFTKKIMYLTSTTGISAYNIGGLTLHSLLGIGTGELPLDIMIKKVSKKIHYKRRIMDMDILFIDEASMLSAELFEKINQLLMTIRRNSLFFGGVQVVLSMDPLQLLPVFKNIKDTRLIIESILFKENFNKSNTIVLRENFRQQTDPNFISLLQRIRLGIFTPKDIELLNTRRLLPNDNNHVHIVTSNYKADQINQQNLTKLAGQALTFPAQYTSVGPNPDTCSLLVSELKLQFLQKNINDSVFKCGARVMLIKNLDITTGLVNGALGTICDFVINNNRQHIPRVKFDNGIIHNVDYATWDLEMDKCIATVKQIPLMLAYSITTHKCQSITLDSAILDLSDCFCDSQVYVALSRVKSLNGIYLKSFDPTKITVNKLMKQFCTET